MSSAADRNLLFGILALQMDFVSREQLIAAVSAWVLEKATPLGAILVRQQALADDRRTLLEALVTEHLKQHGNDPERSLAAVSSIESVRDQLKQLADPEIEASLIHVSCDRDRTDPLATLTVGESTSVGQRFRILRPHAKGGLGEVFVASDEELRREVALKQIQPAHADEPNSRLRFLLEAEITGGLEHPGIVPVYGLGTYADGRPFYAMRFIRGDSLKDAIDRFHSSEAATVDQGERTLQFRKLLGRFIDVCNAIEYAHSRGVLHRDLKPGNIMLGKYGETLVVDWGLAKAVGRSETSSIESDERTLRPSSGSGSAPTQMGSATGTPQYMSPEQAAGRLDLLGPQSDVYSLGATLYCVLCGRSPLGEFKDVGEVLRRVERGEIPPPSSLPVNRSKASIAIPKALEAICLKAMSLKPADRYASPRQLADDLEHWLADEPVRASPDSLPQRLARWTRRHRALVQTLIAASVLLAVVASAAAVLINEQRQAAEDARRNAVRLAADNLDLAQKETEARRRAEAERERANRNQYIALINSAQQAWASGNIAQCLDFLKRLSPLANQLGLGGFEYSYLNRICSDSQRSLELHSESVMSLALAQLKDHSVLLSGGVDGKLIVWDPIKGKPLQILSDKLDSGPGDAKDKNVRGVRAVALTSDGTLAACVTRTQVHIWNVNSGTPIRIIDKISGDTFGLSFTGNDKLLAVPGRRIDPSDRREKSAISWYRSVDNHDDNIEPTFLDAVQNISALTTTADGLTLAVAAGAAIGRQEVRFFDTRDRKERPRLITEHKVVILALAYSPGGDRFATGSADGTISIWNLRDNTMAASLMGHRGFVTAVRFSSDGKKCFSAGADQTVREWDLATNRLLATYRGHKDIVTSLLLLPTPQGDELITASGDHTIRIWPRDPSPYRTVNLTPATSAGNWLASLSKLSEIKYHIADRLLGSHLLVTSLSLAPDRSRLAAVVLAGGRGAVVLRSLNEPKNDLRLLDTERPDQSYACAALSPNGRLLFAGEGNFMEVFVLRATNQVAAPNPSQVVVWDLNKNRVDARKRGPKYDICSLAISTSGERLVTGDVGGGVHIWTASNEKSRELFRGTGLPVVDVRFSNDERYLAAAFAFDDLVRIWEVDSGREVATLEKLGFPAAVAFSPDGLRLAVGTGSALAERARAYGHIEVWDWRGAKLLDTLKGHTQFIRRVAYSADGKRLWSVGFDGASRLWDVDTGDELLKLEGNFHYGLSGDLSRDDKCIAVGTETGEAVLWSTDR